MRTVHGFLFFFYTGMVVSTIVSGALLGSEVRNVQIYYSEGSEGLTTVFLKSLPVHLSVLKV